MEVVVEDVEEEVDNDVVVVVVDDLGKVLK